MPQIPLTLPSPQRGEGERGPAPQVLHPRNLLDFVRGCDHSPPRP